MIDRDDAPFGSPGCHGRALTYRAGTPECDTCPFAQSCEPLSLERTIAVRARMGIVAKSEKAPKPAVVEKPRPVAAMGLSLPVKVVESLGRWERAGIEVTKCLAAGENPFKTTPAYMRVICFVLLRHRQGISRRQLVTCLIHKFGMQENTATPHVTQAVQALSALGAIRDLDGIVSLKV